ncbi:MAG: HDOD domain-containing protein [Bryobacteraceae bacterium]|nr:HDOD domain-containing protein [Bryobacteraceae bacterium]
MPVTTTSSLADIPPFPQVAIRLANLLGKEDCSIQTIADLINTDIALAGRVIQQANSPLYARRGALKSVGQAVTAIGLAKVKTIAMAAVTRNYVGAVMKLPEIQACWQHATATAMLAEEIGEAWGLEPETCYTAGLLHDLGRLGLAIVQGPKYAEFLREGVRPVDPLDREQELFGVAHTEAGRELAAAWRLPEEIVQAAGRHHDVLDGTQADVLLATQMACRLATSFGYRSTQAPAPEPAAVLETLPERWRTKLPADTAGWREQLIERVNAND